jgi:2'-5' RNA ligase
MATFKQRLFFALWPEGAARKEALAFMDGLKPGLQARWCEPGNLHITLAFLGDVEAERAAAAKAAADAAGAPAFALSLERIELWRKPGVLCLTPAQTSDALLGLAEDLAARLRAAGFALENRAYRPHLTLARDATRLPDRLRPSDDAPAGSGRGGDEARLERPIVWTVSRFVLAESVAVERGTEYRVLSEWPLSASG